MHPIHPPFPRNIRGKFHILFAHLRQLHLTYRLLQTDASTYDVYFVDQLSTCIPAIRFLSRKRVVFYCHFPDKLLANGEFVEGKMKMRGSALKRLYRLPMDWLEEFTTRTSLTLSADGQFSDSEGHQEMRISSSPIQDSLPGCSKHTFLVFRWSRASYIQASTFTHMSRLVTVRNLISL